MQSPDQTLKCVDVDDWTWNSNGELKMDKFSTEQQVEEFYNDEGYAEFQELLRQESVSHNEEKGEWDVFW